MKNNTLSEQHIIETEKTVVCTEESSASPKQIVIIFQLVVCAVTALILFAIKGMGGDAYKNIKKYYLIHMNNSVITEFDTNADSSIVNALIHED